jgi:hypothetical protein
MEGIHEITRDVGKCRRCCIASTKSIFRRCNFTSSGKNTGPELTGPIKKDRPDPGPLPWVLYSDIFPLPFVIC